MEIRKSPIASAAGGFEPQRKNNFALQIAPKGGVDMGVIEFAMSKFPFPKSELEKGETQLLNEVRKWAKAPFKFEGGTLTLKDYVDKKVSDAIQKWYKLAADVQSGKIGYASDYKTQATLILFGPNGNNEREWTLYGLWCRGYSNGEGDMSSGDQVEITATLEWDWIEQTKPKIGIEQPKMMAS